MSRAATILRSLVLTVAVGASFAVVPAASMASTTSFGGGGGTTSGGTTSGGTTTTACTAPALAEVFSWAQDTNWYAALPGESWDSMGNGSGWTLSGGAKFVTTTLADGKKGTVLDLPSGSKAVSPSVCVTNTYPASRTEIKDVSGTLGVNISVAYMATSGWGAPQTTGSVAGVGTGWTLPAAFNMKPSNVSGWQLARFTVAAGGTGGEYQLSNFYVDPRMHS